MTNTPEKAVGEKPVAKEGFVHLFDSLMTISSTAKALTEEVLHLAAKANGEGGEGDATQSALGTSTQL